MADFELRITTPVQLEGAKALADETERNIGKAKALGQATDELETKLKTIKGAIGNASEEAKGGGEGFKIFGHGAHEAHAAIHGLGEAIPGVGHLARFLQNEVTGSIGLIILTVAKFKEAMADTMKYLDDLASQPSVRGEWAEETRQHIVESTTAAQLYAGQIYRLATAQQTLQQATDQLIASQRQQASDAGQIADAQRQLEEARLRLAEQLGAVTPEQAIQIRLHIDEAAFKRELDAKIAGIQAELDARQRESGQNEGRFRGLNADVDSAQQAADAAAAAKIKNEGKLKQDQASLEQLKKQVEDANKVIEELEGKGAWGGNWDKSDPQYWKLQGAKNVAETGAVQIAGLQRNIQNEQGKQAGLDTGAKEAEEDLADAREKLKDATKLSTDLQKQINDLQVSLAGEKAKSARLIELHNATAETNADIEANRGVEDLARRAHTAASNLAAPGEGGMVSDLLRDIISLQQGHHAISGAHQMELESLRHEVLELQSQQAQLEQRANMNRTSP